MSHDSCHVSLPIDRIVFIISFHCSFISFYCSEFVEPTDLRILKDKKRDQRISSESPTKMPGVGVAKDKICPFFKVCVVILQPEKRT